MAQLPGAAPPKPLPAGKNSLWERTSFRGGEFLHFAAGPVPSAVGDHHFQLVVAVREQPGHGAPVAISRKTHKLPFFGDPQVLQQAAVSPEIGLQETRRPGEAFSRLMAVFWGFLAVKKQSFAFKSGSRLWKFLEELVKLHEENRGCYPRKRLCRGLRASQNH